MQRSRKCGLACFGTKGCGSPRKRTRKSVFFYCINQQKQCKIILQKNHNYEKKLILFLLILNEPLAYSQNSVVSVTDSIRVTWIGTASPNTPPPGITVSDPTISPITISGTPTEVGTFTFIITTIGDISEPMSDTGTIIIGGCNSNTPNWVREGFPDLGTISWGIVANTEIDSGTTFIPGIGGRPDQRWSGHVFAAACAKGNQTFNNEFNGGAYPSFNADCRQSLHTFNVGRDLAITGDFFSWCAVMRFAAVLCPAPWRVPTIQDFADLHLNLGWTSVPTAHFLHGNTGAYMPTVGTNATPQVGGTWGGVRFGGGVGFNARNFVGNNTDYWMSTETNATTALHSGIEPNQLWLGTNSASKSFGLGLRCVRD